MDHACRCISANASAREPASLLAVFVADDGAKLNLGARRFKVTMLQIETRATQAESDR
jgi:hypothetical protein